MLPSRMFLDDFFDDIDKPKKFDKMMKCDVYEKDNNYVFVIDMPGATKDDISMDIENGYINISYVSSNTKTNDDKKYLHRERHTYTNCSRQFYVGDVDEENIKATFKDGILTITVPLKSKEDSKKIINID